MQMEERKASEEEARQVERRSALFRGPTVVAALVCFVTAAFTFSIGAVGLIVPSDVQNTLLINLSNGQPVSDLVDIMSLVLIVLGVAYVLTGVLLWSSGSWIKGIYIGIAVSIVGTVVSGLSTTFAPGAAAAGMIINVLIVTLLATETWEESRSLKETR
ncbi:MAG: hypothetical protein M1587_09165 [Thaumarchaeota archaeon]|nr:hypothetical protein [Nitrososphaerota archaeon]